MACTDLRGHGDSDTTFASYGDVETAGDIAQIIEELGSPAVIIGNSMAAGAATLVAGDRPDLVAGLVLIGPFVRNGKASAIQRILLRLAMARPWAATSWKSLPAPKLYAGRRPGDFEEYRETVVASLRRPGYAVRPSHSQHGPITTPRRLGWEMCRPPPWGDHGGAGPGLYRSRPPGLVGSSRS